MQKFLLLLACPALALVPSRSLMPRATRVNIPRATVKAVISESAPATQHGQEMAWSPSSWRSKDVEQLPVYEDEKSLLEAEAKLAKCAPLVFAGEIRTLSDSLAQAQSGQAFLLMGGDCAESFEQFDTDKVRDSFRVILQMALVLTFGGSVPVIKVGRIAGQFAKPRSSGMETRDGVSLPSYRGDNVNGEDFTVEARTPDPNRMLKAYNQCAQTLNIIRAFSTGGYAAIERLHAWNLDFVGETEQGSRYRQLATKVDESLRFMKAIGMNTEDPAFTTTAFYTAHECLLLPYEEALTRQDSTTGLWYDCSAHMLWVGERTRQLKNAHLEFCKGVGNPIGIKISDKCDPMDLVRLTEILNPLNTPGRLTIIVRMGAEKLRENLPDLVTTVEKEGRKVLWISDPVHGNTITTASGFKTRDFSAIRAELRAFFDVHEALGTHAGGVHLEMTGEDVTECIGGLADISVEDLELRYKTQCDPRLNGNQALEIAFLIAERMRKRMGLPPVVV